MSTNSAFDHPDRVIVAGTCAECGTGVNMVVLPGWTWDSAIYCRKACERRAYKRRKAGRCPVDGCGRSIIKERAVVCGVCWNRVARQCKGKRRLSEPAAKGVEDRRGLAARWCRCCGWWHNTGHPVEDEQELIHQSGLVLEGMRRARGQIWVNDLIESWDPSQFDRKSWTAISG